ncbi:MAG: hypothetical protein AUH42_02870 [Gemmatimonadetes bacterium 13_1_40CM_70_11]|nr:MAG: hypothetical protein AUH42_02870 [Gemmatimonadetes bacterium 13_1_40CM_70_11]
MTPPAHGQGEGRRLRVALMITARDWRGSAVIFAVVAKGLRQRGHQALALVARTPLREGFQHEGVPVRQLAIGATGFPEARRTHRALAEFAADIVLADARRDVRLAAAASLVRPVRIVYCISTPSPPGDPLTRLAYRRLSLTVFLTRRLEADGIRRLPMLARRPHRVISNGVDGGVFRPDLGAGRAFRERQGLGDQPILLAVGALEPEKRWEMLVQSLALLPRPIPPLFLRGSGRLEASLRAQAERLGLDLRILPRLPAADLVAAYNAATCVVHASPSEPFGLVVAEAMACGRPVVAVAGGGPEEVLGDAGVVTPPEEPAVFARHLQALLADPGRQAALGQAGRRRVLERYSVERMQREHVEAIEALG